MALKTRFENIEKCLINTGNILSLNDITRKSGQNPTEELIEAINITIKEYENNINSQNYSDYNDLLIINRPQDDLAEKMNKQDLNDLKIGIKFFLNKQTKNLITEALEKAFNTLNVDNVDNVVIAFKPKPTETDNYIDDIKPIWCILENYVKQQKINLLGLADIEETTFRAIYEWANIKPNIIQINLASCCVVPPTLQAFCKDNDVLLLTHSDAVDFLPITAAEDLFGNSLNVKWILRFLVHIKCRGVLTTKGYLISLESK